MSTSLGSQWLFVEGPCTQEPPVRMRLSCELSRRHRRLDSDTDVEDRLLVPWGRGRSPRAAPFMMIGWTQSRRSGTPSGIYVGDPPRLLRTPTRLKGKV